MATLQINDLKAGMIELKTTRALREEILVETDKIKRYRDYRMLGLPVIGSKRKIAKNIVDKIIKDNPNMKYFYDMFGGGGAIAIEMANRGVKTYYNDKDWRLVNALQFAIENKVEASDTEWIDRNGFIKRKTSTQPKHALQVIAYSFSSDRASYTYSLVNEEIMCVIHKLLVDNSYTAKEFLAKKFSLNMAGLNAERDLYQRAKILTQLLKSRDVRLDVSHLSRTRQIEKLFECVPRGKLHFTALDYRSINIPFQPSEVVVYLDTPYKNTKGYYHGVNYWELNQFVKYSRFKIYLSEYSSTFKEVLSLNKRVTNGSGNTIVKQEKLFTN